MAKSGGYTFIIEMLLVTLFFSLAAAILLQVFVAARLQSDENVATNRALIVAQSALEIAQAEDTPEQTVCYWYDAEWQPVEDAEQARFCVTVSCVLEESSPAAELYLLSAETDDLQNDRQLLPILTDRKIRYRGNGQ